jgi:hypothetical protein
MQAFKDRDPQSIYNRIIAGQALGLPEDVASWDAAQNAQADTYLKTYLSRANWDMEIAREIFPFDYQHNDKLAGVEIVFRTRIQMDCPAGTFEQKLC